MNAYIVDDELKSLEVLRSKISRICPQINVLDSFMNSADALKAIQKKKPDLLFLDIAMPILNGFELLKEIKEPNFEIIFVTAFDEYALDAIKHSAIGYLIKPFSNDELKEAVERAELNFKKKRSFYNNTKLIEQMEFHTNTDSKIMIPTVDGIQFVALSEITYLAGESGYTRIHFNSSDSLLSSYSIGYFEKNLNSSSFYKVHRSYIVNTKKVKKILNSGNIVLSNDTELPISKKRKEELIIRLNS